MLKENVIYNFRPIGIAVDFVNNVTIDGNVVSHIVDRQTVDGFNFIDKSAAYAICSYFEPEICRDVSVTNNIASGATYAGFTIMGHECGQSDTQKIFRGNVAHSIGGEAGPMGNGALFYPDSSKPS